MNSIVEIIYSIKSKHSKSYVQHVLNVSLNGDVIKNPKRLYSHCRSLGLRTYGNNCTLLKITDLYGKVLYEN